MSLIFVLFNRPMSNFTTQIDRAYYGFYSMAIVTFTMLPTAKYSMTLTLTLTLE